MKTILYFVLSICSLIYITVLCALNICGEAVVATWGAWGSILCGIGTYGGLVIILAFALINFFGNPIKIVFLVLLILAIIIYVVSTIVPDAFRNLFGVESPAVIEMGVRAVKTCLGF